MSDLSPFKELIDKASDIIKAASQSPLGIVALVILVVFVVGYVWFNPSSTRVRIGIFAGMIVTALVFFVVGLRGVPSKPVPPPPGPVAPGPAQLMTYVGRVQNRATLDPVEGAKAEIDVEQSSKYDYTDSDGIYRVKIGQLKPDSEARLHIQAEGYRAFDLHLPGDSATSILPVRLDPVKGSSIAAARPVNRKATYLGRVLDDVTRSPVIGAKVILGVGPPAYTDNEGAFWFDLSGPPKGPLRLLVSAQGYKSYELTLPPNEAGKPIDVRMNKLKADATPR
jgi:hypothetical protein